MGRIAKQVAVSVVLSGWLGVSGCQHAEKTAQNLPDLMPDHMRSVETLTAHGHVTILLSLWHRAAAKGDFQGYFGRMTDRAVFCGTDASERWTRDEFIRFATPYFDGVEAWTYHQIESNLIVGPGEDPSVVWFDELLRSEKYGDCRGTGVAERGADGKWRIAHYSLSLLVPNDAANDVVDLIRDFE